MKRALRENPQCKPKLAVVIGGIRPDRFGGIPHSGSKRSPSGLEE
jgi:hypothetical protein